MIVTYTPSSARKQAYTFDDKLEAMRQELLAMRAKVRDNAPHWRKEEAVRERYIRFCEQIHMAPQLYELQFDTVLPEPIIAPARIQIVWI